MEITASRMRKLLGRRAGAKDKPGSEGIMKVECESCHVKINLPDDKLVPGKEFGFTCPKCKSKNSFMVPGGEEPTGLEPTEQQESATSQEEAAPLPPPAESGFDDDDDAAAGEFYEEGAKLALICFDEGPERDRLAEIMTGLGYVPVIPESIRDALNRIRMTQFRTVLLHENYDNFTDGQHPILRILQPMNMSTRRQIFLALFGKNWQSLDHMTAFQLSVNAVVSLDDDQKYDKILFRGLADYERFYRVFFEISRDLGKN